MYNSLTIPEATRTDNADNGLTPYYDYNVWTHDGELKLTAYQHIYTEDGQTPIATDTAHYNTLTIPVTAENAGLFDYLLETTEWRDEVSGLALDDFDTWCDEDFLLKSGSPAVLDWLTVLPSYLPNVAHDFDYDEGTGSHPNAMDGVNTCTVCGIQYVMARASVFS